MVAHHTDEPQEGDPGEWHYAQAPATVFACSSNQNRRRTGGNREPDEHIGGDMQHGKEDTKGQPVELLLFTPNQRAGQLRKSPSIHALFQNEYG
ncbi:hypothetical protein [Methanosarcina siciliae]|uniref:hypothetical protein n=1 Tax=Methanosarcina siciliae TaxID=38027 RepID=UPI00064F92C1|nr:hypothetical protein [Methanosarcina siciliae]